MVNGRLSAVLIWTIFVIIIFIGSGTVFAKDTINPTVVSIDPTNNSYISSSNQVIKLAFSEPIKTGTGFVELRTNNSHISVNKTVTNKILTIKPNSVLKTGSTYTLYLHSNSYTDLAGNPVSLYNSSFKVNTNKGSMVYLQKISSDTTVNGQTSYAKYAIYQKPSNCTTWNRYLFNHMVNKAKPGVNGAENDYRIYKLQNVVSGTITTSSLDIKATEDLTSPGNWEKALRIAGKSEKIGGMHGYEIYTGIIFIEDGKRIFPDTNLITKCNNLQICETSDLFNPNNPAQVVAKTTTIYEWNGETLKLRNIYKWKINTRVVEAYAAMFPTRDSPTVTSRGEIKGSSEENFQTRTKVLHLNSAMGVVWNNKNNLHMSMEITNPKTALNNYLNSGNSKIGETWFRTSGKYIKLYMSRVSPPKSEKITPNTVWDIRTVYKVWNE